MPALLVVSDDHSSNGIRRRTILSINSEVSARFSSGRPLWERFHFHCHTSASSPL